MRRRLRALTPNALMRRRRGRGTPAEDGFTDLIQAMIFHMSSSDLTIVPIVRASARPRSRSPCGYSPASAARRSRARSGGTACRRPCRRPRPRWSAADPCRRRRCRHDSRCSPQPCISDGLPRRPWRSRRRDFSGCPSRRSRAVSSGLPPPAAAGACRSAPRLQDQATPTTAHGELPATTLGMAVLIQWALRGDLSVRPSRSARLWARPGAAATWSSKPAPKAAGSLAFCRARPRGGNFCRLTRVRDVMLYHRA